METFELTTADLPTLYEALQPLAAKWCDTGLQMNIPIYELDIIRANHAHEGVRACLREVLKVWLKSLEPQAPSWPNLVAVLRKESIGEYSLAVQLEKKHCPHTQQLSEVQQRELTTSSDAWPFIEILCEQFKIPLNEKCSTGIFLKMKAFFNWQAISPHLNIDVTDIAQTNISRRKKRWKTLQRWREKSGDGATYRTLMKAMLKAGETDQICELLKLFIGITHKESDDSEIEGKVRHLQQYLKGSVGASSSFHTAEEQTVRDSEHTTSPHTGHEQAIEMELHPIPSACDDEVKVEGISLSETTPDCQPVLSNEGGVDASSCTSIQVKPPTNELPSDGSNNSVNSKDNSDRAYYRFLIGGSVILTIALLIFLALGVGFMLSSSRQPITDSFLIRPNDTSLVRNEGFDPYDFHSVLISKNDKLDTHVVKLYLECCNELVVSEMAIQTEKHCEDCGENTLLDSHYLVVGSELNYVVTLHEIIATDENHTAIYVFDNVEDHLNFIQFNITHEPVYTFLPSNGTAHFTVTASTTSYFFIDLYTPSTMNPEYQVNGTILYYDPANITCEIHPGDNTNCLISLGPGPVTTKDNPYCILSQFESLETDNGNTSVNLTYLASGGDSLRNPKRITRFSIGLTFIILAYFCFLVSLAWGSGWIIVLL